MLLALLVPLLLAGCAYTPYPEAPTTVAAAEDDRYIIGPGDSLEIVVWGNPEVSRGVTVPPDGVITVPLVEDLPATGKRGTELAREIEQELAQYIREPVVTVIVSGFVGPFDRQVRVVGEAANPQALQYREGLTALDVMIEVGGLTDFAAGNRATIVRREDGERRQYNVRLEDLVKDGDVSANVQMLPGDILIIPESLF
ncbi:XrtA/PEP-CTERM system exopolysaccharide export protein [Sediminicurvatus halobius]|nr:XrtA/PEP-CTERM system exopolysaccharide export protein [Spiribacter halobius]UEX77361.1 polysaccharide export protein [Spiribacter halobius]